MVYKWSTKLGKRKFDKVLFKLNCSRVAMPQPDVAIKHVSIFWGYSSSIVQETCKSSQDEILFFLTSELLLQTDL
jgi:hypothetical protein